MSVVALNFGLRRFGWAAVLVLGFPVLAQQTITFTKPVNQDPVKAANDLRAPRPSPRALSAPVSLFGDPGGSFDNLPGGPQAILMNHNSAEWQRLLDDRKNWALLTPKEILNVPTAESILGIPDSEDSLKLSAEQRFLRRQDRDSQIMATKGMLRSDSELERGNGQKDGLLQDQDDNRQLGEALGSPTSILPDQLKNLKPFDARELGTEADRNEVDPTWTSPFGVKVMEKKQTPEQLQGMERFRAMMEPTAPVLKPASPVFATPSFSAQDQNAESLSANKSVGRGYTALEDGMAKPAGLLPLQGLGAQPAPPKKVSWVQPPPWASESPQSSTFPQRQF